MIGPEGIDEFQTILCLVMLLLDLDGDEFVVAPPGDLAGDVGEFFDVLVPALPKVVHADNDLLEVLETHLHQGSAVDQLVDSGIQIGRDGLYKRQSTLDRVRTDAELLVQVSENLVQRFLQLLDGSGVENLFNRESVEKLVIPLHAILRLFQPSVGLEACRHTMTLCLFQYPHGKLHTRARKLLLYAVDRGFRCQPKVLLLRRTADRAFVRLLRELADLPDPIVCHSLKLVQNAAVVQDVVGNLRNSFSDVVLRFLQLLKNSLVYL